MKNVLRSVRVAALGAAVLVSYATFGAATSSVAGADTSVSAFYLDIGGSASLGVQPTIAFPKGQRTDDGYADYLVKLEATKGESLDLHEIGCSGETTNTMLHGGDKCDVVPDTQLNVAMSFLKAHHDDDGLVTIDLGFNDLRPCFHDWASNQVCVDRHLIIMRQQLEEIIDLLKDVAGPNVKFIGVGHYDPYLGDAVNVLKNPMVVKRSVVVVQHLDQVLAAVYQLNGIPFANVGQAFMTTSTTPVAVPGLGTVPENVAEVCQLTWMCQPEPLGPNIHPNAAGYQTIATAIDQVLTPW